MHGLAKPLDVRRVLHLNVLRQQASPATWQKIQQLAQKLGELNKEVAGAARSAGTIRTNATKVRARGRRSDNEQVRGAALNLLNGLSNSSRGVVQDAAPLGFDCLARGLPRDLDCGRIDLPRQHTPNRNTQSPQGQRG